VLVFLGQLFMDSGFAGRACPRAGHGPDPGARAPE
jgi:hypothetical protein